MPEANRPVVWKYLRSPAVRWLETLFGTWTTESDPSCHPVSREYTVYNNDLADRTSEEQLFCSLQKAVLCLCGCDWVESPNAHDFPDSLPTSIIRI